MTVSTFPSVHKRCGVPIDEERGWQSTDTSTTLETWRSSVRKRRPGAVAISAKSSARNSSHVRQPRKPALSSAGRRNDVGSGGSRATLRR